MFPIPVNTGALSTTSPNMVLNFTSGVLDPRITFTRTQGATNAATYYNSSGVLSYSTANTPRFDYDPVALTPKGLLIEETRTNLLTYSSDFTNAIWSKSNASVTSAVGTAPDGTLTAQSIQSNAGTFGNASNGITKAASAIAYSYSVYAKSNGFNWLCLTLYSGTNGSRGWFNLSTGATGSTATIGSGFTSVSLSITPAGNSWYRCTIVATTDTLTNLYLYVYPTNADATFSTGNGTSGILIWGSQLEAGAFQTSYIPTVAATVQRGADNASMTGTNFSSWYNQSQGTFTTSVIAISATNNRVFSVSAGPNPRLMDVYTAGIPTRLVYYTNVTSAQYDTGATSLTAKVAINYSSAGMQSAGNGLVGGSNATNATTVAAQATKMEIGSWNNSSQLNGWIYFIKYYPLALTTSQLQGITK